MRPWCHVALLACLSVKLLMADSIYCNDPDLCRQDESVEKRDYLRFGRAQVDDNDEDDDDNGSVEKDEGDSYLREARADPFIRFGKSDPFIRFGKSDPFIRFGKSDPFIRFGKRQDPFIRFGRADPFIRFGKRDAGEGDGDSQDEMEKRQDPFIRFGKRQDPFIRFGRGDPFIRFGRGDPFIRFGRGDPFIRFGKREDPIIRIGKKQDPFIRFGKREDPIIRIGKKQDPFIRFGKRQDPFIRFGKRQDPFIRFGRGDPFIRFGKSDPFIRFGRGDPFIRFGRGDPFIRFGKRSGTSEVQETEDSALSRAVRSTGKTPEQANSSRAKRDVTTTQDSSSYNDINTFSMVKRSNDHPEYMRFGRSNGRPSDDDVIALMNGFARGTRMYTDRSALPRFGKREEILEEGGGDGAVNEEKRQTYMRFGRRSDEQTLKKKETEVGNESEAATS